MKKLFLFLAAMLVSFAAFGAKVVPTKSTYPVYEGYFATQGSADELFAKMIDGIDSGMQKGMHYTIDRENNILTLSMTESEDGIDITIKILLATQTDRILYRVTVAIMYGGEDLTEMMGPQGMAKAMDQAIPQLLQELAKEL